MQISSGTGKEATEKATSLLLAITLHKLNSFLSQLGEEVIHSDVAACAHAVMLVLKGM